MAMDSEQLLRLVLTHRGMLLGYILSIVRDVHLAEDVFQDASLIILKKGSIVEDEAGFPAWARKIARFEALNALRKQGKGPELLEPALLDLLEDEWNKAAEPDAAMAALRRCLEELPDKARRLIELRYVAQLPGNKLAERLKQPPNTVYVALSRTYRILGKCVQERLAKEG